MILVIHAGSSCVAKFHHGRLLAFGGWQLVEFRVLIVAGRQGPVMGVNWGRIL